MNFTHCLPKALAVRAVSMTCLISASSGAVIYTQNFDTFDDVPNSTVFYDAAPVYDGISGTPTGASLGGNANLNGRLLTQAGSLVAHSASYFLHTNTLGTIPAGEVWGTNSTQTIAVEVGEIYEFSFYLAGINGIAPAQLTAQINGVSLSSLVVDSVTNPGTATYTGATGWQQFTYRWQADSTTADLSIFNSQDTSTGNDFGLDTITFSSVPEPSAALLGVLGMAGLLRRRRA